VVRRLGVTCGIASVKLSRLQIELWRRYRVEFHRRTIGLALYRTSLWLVKLRSLTGPEAIPQSRRREAFVSTVITSTTWVSEGRDALDCSV
jgi:hypothetical protein